MGGRSQGGSEAVNAADDVRMPPDVMAGRGARHGGRGGRGRRSGNGRGQEGADADGAGRGERSSAGDGATEAPQADSKSHDARNGAAGRTAGPGRGKRTADPSRTQGRGSGRHSEGSLQRRRDGADSAVNVGSAAAAAQAAAEIAPQVFTQALAKIEAFKIPVRLTTPPQHASASTSALFI